MTASNLLPHQQRMIDVYSELSERLSRLRHFFDNPAFDSLTEAEKVRLKSQELFMTGYQTILNERISAM